MAERFTEKVSFQPVPTSTGEAQGMMSLAEKLERFKSVAYQQATIAAQTRGAAKAGQVKLEKGETGVTKSPEFKKQGFIGGVETQSYNAALKGAYIASLNRDIRTSVSEIRDNNPDDLTSFNDKIEVLRNSVLQGVDPLVRKDAEDLFNDVSTSARIQVQTENIRKNRDAAKLELETSADLILNDALTYSNNGDFYSAAKGLLDYAAILNNQKEAGFINESQATEKVRQAQVYLTHENMVGDIRRITQTGDFKGAIKKISAVRENIPTGLSPDEHGKLMTEMISELNQALSLSNKMDSLENDNIKANQSTNYGELAIGIAQGTMGLNHAIKMLRNKDITENQFDKITGTLNSRGRGTNDYALVNQLNDAIEDLGSGGQAMTPEFIQNAILSNMGHSLTDTKASELLTRLNEYRNPDFVLNTSEVKRAKSFIVPSMRIVGLAGAFDTEAERRLANAIRTFDDRVIAGEDPWMVADELIGKDQIARKPQPMYGSKTDLQTAREQLNAAAKHGEIDRATYNYQDNLIKELDQLINTQKAFDEARKNANANAIR